MIRIFARPSYIFYREQKKVSKNMANKIKDLTGQKFGILQVLQLDKSKEPNRRKWWICKCQCGNIKSIRQDALQKAESCGCLRTAKLKTITHYKDHTGEKYGKLTLLYITDKRNTQDRPYWHCRCECGNEIDVLIGDLQSGHTTSCGCVKSKGELKIGQLLTENKIPFEKQKTFDSCRFQDTNQLARFDFYVDNSYIIEFDGAQHFQFSNNGWNNEENFKRTQKRDEFKNQWCKENDIPLIRIPYIQLEALIIEDLLLKTTKFLI